MATNLFRRRLLLLFALSFLAAPFMAAAAQAADVTVFAAASLKNALDDAAKLYQTKTGDKVNISYAASSALAKQIEAGAPADIFFSADLDWMDYLQEKKLIDDASRHTLLGNTLVLVAPKDSTVTLPIVKDFPIVQALGPDGKLAMASVDSVPAGKYGKAALTYLGVWDAVLPHVVQAENVRAALAFVAKGEAALGIVYGTDAKSEPAVRASGCSPRTAIRRSSIRSRSPPRPSRRRANSSTSSSPPRPRRPSRRKASRFKARLARRGRTHEKAQREKPAQGQGRRGQEGPDDRPCAESISAAASSSRRPSPMKRWTIWHWPRATTCSPSSRLSDVMVAK